MNAHLTSHFTKNMLRCGAGVLLALAAWGAQARTAVSVNLGFGVGYPAAPYGAAWGGYYGGVPYWHRAGVWYRPWGPSWVVVAPPVAYYPYPAPVVVEPAPVAPPPAVVSAAPTRPDPIIYPRNGQSAAQTEADRQECNRWATTQPSAVADASVFQRAVEACMDGRGYTMK